MLGFMSFFCILLSLYLKGRKYEVFLGEFYHTSKITSCLLIVYEKLAVEIWRDHGTICGTQNCGAQIV